MKEHHLQLNLAKTELLVFPATPTLQHDFTIQIGSSTITPSTSVRNLGVIFDDQLTFKVHIAKTARSCRFAQHNIGKIRPSFTQHSAQLLVQALVISRLDYCNALLAGLPSCKIKPFQIIQNAAARLVFSEPKRAHCTPLFISLHWLPVMSILISCVLVSCAAHGWWFCFAGHVVVFLFCLPCPALPCPALPCPAKPGCQLSCFSLMG